MRDTSTVTIAARAEVVTRASAETVLALLCENLEHIPRAKIKARTPTEMMLRVGPSWRSWGENVWVVATDRDGQTVVSIYSRSRLRTALFDSGKNKANVNAVLKVVAGLHLDD